MKQNLVYAGVGSRSTPPSILKLMHAFAKLVAGKGDWILRSGGAIGADLAFELGCNEEGGKKEIYLASPRRDGWSKNDYVIPDVEEEVREFIRENS